MNILVIGSGGREHAIIRCLHKSPIVTRLYALPGNPGMSEATCLPGNLMDNNAAVQLALEKKIDFCVVTPDDPLANGMVDAMEAAGIQCFGPDQKAARIESSKVFSKQLMQKYGIPTAKFAAFDQMHSALAYVEDQPLPLVIKADGLARGKGVIIAQTLKEAKEAIVDMMEHEVFGESGRQIIIEEFLEGPEVSVLALTDGNSIIPLLSAMDHKRALDGDLGPNTGGMGVIAPNPFYTQNQADQAMETIFLPTIKAMDLEGCPFRGCLFFGLMLTKDGPKVLEYNARFGDPETQAVLSLLDSDLLTALVACRKGTLHKTPVSFTKQHACCVVLTSKGYPGKIETGFSINWDNVNANLDFAGVKSVDGKLKSAGGRVVGVTALGDSLQEAVNSAYQQVEKITFTGKTFRRDIGLRALK